MAGGVGSSGVVSILLLCCVAVIVTFVRLVGLAGMLVFAFLVGVMDGDGIMETVSFSDSVFAMPATKYIAIRPIISNAKGENIRIRRPNLLKRLRYVLFNQNTGIGIAYST